jgi:hypothetical protein
LFFSYAFALRRAAQYLFILWDWALRAAALMPLRLLVGSELGREVAAVAVPAEFLRGGPGALWVGPCKTSIALVSRSRSSMSNSTIWSVGTVFDDSTGVWWKITAVD